MNNCRKCCSLFVEALCNELDIEQKEWFDTHLQSCSNCVADYEKLKAIMGIMKQRSRTEPDSFFWDSYWDRLAERMETGEKSVSTISAWWQHFWQGINLQPSWAYRAATAVALIAIGVLIGKLYFGRPVSKQVETAHTVQVPPTAVEQVALQQRTDRYIERSKILLLGLINFDPDSEDAYALNLPYQKQISQELVREANSLKEGLNDPDQQQLRALIEDLKIILIQIANLESEHDLTGIELVKSGVDRRGILLKINLEEMQGEPDYQVKNADKKKI